MIIKNAEIFDDDFNRVRADIEISGEQIIRIGEGLSGEQELDYSGSVVLPGFIDIHIHGCNASDATDGTPDAVLKMSEYLIKKGVTSFCPTTMTVPYERIRESFNYISSAMGWETGAYIHGINMEGPFISEKKKGAQAAENILLPDIDMLRLLNAICPVKLVDIAPEVSGATEFIEEAKSICTVSAAHTAASCAEAKAGIAAGITHATHLHNAMTPLTSREAGVVGAVLGSENVRAELICDGFHICPETLRLTFKLLGEDRSIIISDCIMAGGLSDGEYTLGGQQVFVNGSAARLADGTIAGSTTNLFDEFQNVLSFGIPLRQAVKSCTINPAKAIGAGEKTGSIKEGKYADLLILNSDLSQIKTVLVRGRITDI